MADEQHYPNLGVSPVDVCTICHRCCGTGTRYERYAATLFNQLGTIEALAPCPACEMTGRIEGIIPPM